MHTFCREVAYRLNFISVMTSRRANVFEIVQGEKGACVGKLQRSQETPAQQNKRSGAGVSSALEAQASCTYCTQH
jgi:hypothetical protein